MYIFWDWNGTLLDDVIASVEILNMMLRKRGLKTVSLNEYYDIFDFPVIEYYNRAGFDMSKESFESIARDYIDAYDAASGYFTLQPYAAETVKKLNNDGHTQLILSAANVEMLEQMLDKFDLKQYFTDVYGHNDSYAYSKVQLGIEAISDLDINPSEALLIGDTLHDKAVADALGCRCILVSGGHHDFNKLMTAGVPVYNDLSEVYQAIKINYQGEK